MQRECAVRYIRKACLNRAKDYMRVREYGVELKACHLEESRTE